MAKKKHKEKKKYVNPVEQKKQQEAQYRQLFLEKLQNLCRQIGGETLFQQIPPVERMVLYMFRGAPLKVVAADGVKIQKRLMESLTKHIKTQQLSMKLEVTKGSGEMMTFADYLLVGMSLEFQAGKTDDYPAKEQFAKFVELRTEHEEEYEKGIKSICSLACWIFDDIEKKYLHTYQLETFVPSAESGLFMPEDDAPVNRRMAEKYMSQDFRLRQKITIGIHRLETRKVLIKGETHSAIQVGILLYPNNEPKFHQFTLSPDDMHLKTNPQFSKLGLPIYIQQHALNRMRKRLGLVIPAFYSIILAEAFLRKEITPVTKKRILVACFTNELKIGYLLGERVDGIILIRTFLLLTNGGTPEGDKLSELTGLQTEDRKYLSIDTLPGLANSDIAQNEAICKLFRDAGCGSILELCEKINNEKGMMWLLDKSQPKNIISDLITDYMKPNTDDEEEWVENND
ncbi:MAG: hypothetical protein LBL13_09980 [Bacteroidales bacterium]|jgi:hypothetical protein|nr:hypothetical protein [Bacteroidales bacterium]